MKEISYVEDIIVPLIAIPKNDENIFRFLGSGFYVSEKGHLVTCRHVVDEINEGERLYAYQMGKKKELELEIINIKSYMIQMEH